MVQRAHGRAIDQPSGGRSPVHAIGALQRRDRAVDGAAVGGRVAFAEVVRFDAGVVTAENLLWIGARLDAALWGVGR